MTDRGDHVHLVTEPLQPEKSLGELIGAMNTALAFAVVGVLWAVIAAVLAIRAKKKLASTKALPETAETLKEDVQWTKAQSSCR